MADIHISQVSPLAALIETSITATGCPDTPSPHLRLSSSTDMSAGQWIDLRQLKNLLIMLQVQ